MLGGGRISTVPLPLDYLDGFGEAFYGRPEAFLDPAVRAAQSGWQFMDEPTAERGVAKLADEFGYGKWDRHFGHVRTQPEFNVQLGSSARLSSRVRRVCSWSYRMA